jgi:hypothetical protein
VQAIGRQPQRAPDGARLHYERPLPEQTTLYRLVGTAGLHWLQGQRAGLAAGPRAAPTGAT